MSRFCDGMWLQLVEKPKLSWWVNVSIDSYTRVVHGLTMEVDWPAAWFTTSRIMHGLVIFTYLAT